MCWFIHRKNQNKLDESVKEEPKNSELMEKLMKMVKDYSERINRFDAMLTNQLQNMTN